jgi:hypothetical protein
MSVKIDGSGIITGLDADGISAQPVFPGNVLQVVHASHNTEVSTTSGTYADTGISATITPTSATSKILVLYSVGYLSQDSNIPKIRLVRNSTEIQACERAINAAHASYMHNEHLDAPATTSATTYKIQSAKLISGGSAFITCWNSEQPSTITLMEIAG